jgi:putative acyl-CoA dehydrogenase
MTPVDKYWCCKIAPALIYEAMECIGGSGYVEERPIARHYREAPVNAIWEGSGNVMALDVLRVLSRGKDLFESVFAGIARDLGPSPAQDGRGAARSHGLVRARGGARILVEQLALSPPPPNSNRIGAGRIADAFIETRLAGAGARPTACSIRASTRASSSISFTRTPPDRPAPDSNPPKSRRR